MNDELKRALAAAGGDPLADALKSSSLTEAALRAGDPGASLRDFVSRWDAGASSPFAKLAAEAQRFAAADAEIRRMSDWLSTSLREPQVADIMAGLDRTSVISKAFSVESSIATRMAEAERGGSAVSKLLAGNAANRALKSVERYRDSFASITAGSSALARLLAGFDRSASASLAAADASISSFLSTQVSAARGISRIAEEVRAFDAELMGRLTKPFDQVGKLALMGELPPSFASVFAKASAGAKYLDSIHLPVIDTASAAAIGRYWGEEGLDRQLRALGILTAEPKGSEISEPAIPVKQWGMPSFSNVFNLISILLAFYAVWDSQQMEARIIGAIREDQSQREAQFEAVKALIASALAQQAAREEQRFLCKARIAVVRSAPESGSSRTGSVFPNQVVKPVAEAGKWIQVEYYDFLAQETRIGWALKKYFTRVRASAEADE